MMSVKIYTKTLLLISLMLSCTMASAQKETMLTRTQEGQSRFGVPVIAEEGGDGWLRIYYVVKPGNTLYSVSRQFGLSVADVRKTNDLTSDVIYVGQRLLMMREELPFVKAEKPAPQAQMALPRPAEPKTPVAAQEKTPVQAPVAEEIPPAEVNGLIIIDNFDDASGKAGKKEFGQ